MVTTAVGGAQGGFFLVVQYLPQGWSVDSMRFHRTNMVVCKIVSSDQTTPLMGAYLPPLTMFQ